MRLAQRGDEGGFTLVEVMAAMVVFALVATGVTAMFASGLRASLLTKMETTAKNLSQQRFEQIRNLPFHIDQVTVGENPPDLLDTYFPNTTPAAGRGLPGYVGATSPRWTDDGDPADGAFYRYVQDELDGFPKFKQYIATQFLTDSGTPHAATGFDSQVSGMDTPPTLAVGVGVTTVWKAGELERVSRTYSQVTAARPAPPNAVLQQRLTALRLTGGMPAGQTLSLDVASLNADGALSQTVNAAQALRGASLSLSGGPSLSGAASSVQAPPNSGSTGTGAGPKALVDSATEWASVGNTHTSNVLATSSTGQVVLSSAASPASAVLRAGGGGAHVAKFMLDANADPRLGLLAQHAFVADAGCGGSCTNIGVSGWANTTKNGSGFGTRTSATATVASTLALLPTTYAPLGLIRIKLTSATMSCQVTRSSAGSPVAAASLTYDGTLSYWAPFDLGAVGGYKTVALSSTQATSPLTPALLSQTQTGTDSTGNPLWLSDYFATWGSMDSTSVASAKTIATDGTTAAMSFGGVINVQSVPLRPGDDSAVIAAQLAGGACSAEDHR